MMPGQVCYEPVIQLFGEWIVKEDGSLDRETISKIVFEKKEILEKLNAIIHPAVKKYILREIERSKKEKTEFFFIEAALLIEEKYDEILYILMDLENESDEINPMIVEINEDDHVELNNGKSGIVADITNNVYTIEVDEKFKTGNIDDDIMIVAANSIIGRK